MNEPIRLELTEEEWRVLIIAVDMELRRVCAPTSVEENERVFDKLRKAKFEWEQKKIRERVKR